MGYTAYVHNNSHQYGKLGPRRKKCIRYSKLFKGFVFVGEEVDGRVTKFESQDVIFLKKDYPMRDEIDNDFQFYEMKDLDYGAPIHSVEGLKETFNLSENNGSDYVLDLTPMEQDHEKSQPHLSTRE